MLDWCKTEALTTVIHAVEPGDIHRTEVQPLADDIIKVRYGGGDGWDAGVLVEGQRPVVHDGLVVIRRVHVGDEVVLVLVETVLLPCEEREDRHVDSRLIVAQNHTRHTVRSKVYIHS